jgi:prepilin-type N-terminal cleavage/methylation domain-containing protein
VRREIKANRKKDAGFTLIELIVVVMVIAVLAAIAVPLYAGYVRRATASEGVTRLGSIMTASKAYYQRYDQWPAGETSDSYYAVFTDSEHFEYSIESGAGGKGAFVVRADGLDVDGMSGVTITMTCLDARAEGVVAMSGI